MSRFIKPSKPAEGSRLHRIQEALKPLCSFQYGAGRSASIDTSALSTKATQATLASLKFDHVAIARLEAKARHSNVMSSTAVTGREKQVAQLLMASCSHTAKFRSSSQIIAELQKRPSDAQLAAKLTSERRKKNDAVWESAHASLAAQKRVCREPNQKASETVVANRTDAGNTTKRESDAAWERAWYSPRVKGGF